MQEKNNQESSYQNAIEDLVPDLVPELTQAEKEALQLQAKEQASQELAKHLNTELLISEPKILDLLEQGANPDIQTEEGKYLINLLLDSYANKAAKELIEKHQADVSLAFGIPANFLIDLQQVERKPELLGKGGYAEVFQGKFQDKDVAIKSFNMQEKNFSKSFKNFMQEIENLILLSKENSPHLIKFIGISISGPDYCIFLEIAILGSLASLIKKNPELLDSQKRQEIIRDMIDGLKVIHPHLIHADVKSENLLLTDNFQVKWADFGLSHSGLSKKKSGTPRTMAPELLRGKCNSIKADIYGLGMTICEVLIAKLLKFPGYIELSKNTKSSLASFLQTNRFPIPETESSFKMDLIINACWHNSPEHRPTADELSDLLKLDEMKVFQQLKTRVANPLTLACKYGKLDLIKILVLEYDINLRSQEDGFTPLLAACASSFTKDKPELFAFLIERKASLFAISDAGETALDLAFAKENEAAIKILMHLALSLASINKALMSDKTLVLAKEWVKKNHCEAVFTDAFFNDLENINRKLKNSNFNFIKNAKSKQELYAAIEQVGFFFSPKGTLNKKTTRSLVFEYFENDLRFDSVPKDYGLREKAMELSFTEKLLHIRNKEEFLKLIDLMGFMPASPGKIYNVAGAKKRINFFLDLQNSAQCTLIPEIYGLRAKAITLLFSNLTTRKELELAISKIDLFPKNRSSEEVFQIVEDYLENRSLLIEIPDFYGLRATAMEVKESEFAQKRFSPI